MIGVMLIQDGNIIRKTWILLDILSTDSTTKKLDNVEDVKNFSKDKELTVLKMEGS